jgi:hypothetical protein
MKKLLIIIVITALSSTNVKAQTQQPEKRYPIYLTLNQIQVLVTAVQSPDDVSANAKKNVLSDIVAQTNAQLAPPKKDSTKTK